MVLRLNLPVQSKPIGRAICDEKGACLIDGPHPGRETAGRKAPSRNRNIVLQTPAEPRRGGKGRRSRKAPVRGKTFRSGIRKDGPNHGRSSRAGSGAGSPRTFLEAAPGQIVQAAARLDDVAEDAGPGDWREGRGRAGHCFRIFAQTSGSGPDRPESALETGRSVELRAVCTSNHPRTPQP